MKLPGILEISLALDATGVFTSFPKFQALKDAVLKFLYLLP
jgi:hypothetical protein